MTKPWKKYLWTYIGLATIVLLMGLGLGFMFAYGLDRTKYFYEYSLAVSCIPAMLGFPVFLICEYFNALTLKKMDQPLSEVAPKKHLLTYRISFGVTLTFAIIGLVFFFHHDENPAWRFEGVAFISLISFPGMLAYFITDLVLSILEKAEPERILILSVCLILTLGVEILGLYHLFHTGDEWMLLYLLYPLMCCFLLIYKKKDA